MSFTTHLALPLIAAAQAQKHVTHNEALARIDALVHLSVKERHRVAAPSDPAEGDRYLVGAGATGVFAGREDQVALFDLGVWRFLAPGPGWLAYVAAEDCILSHDGTAWQDLRRYGSTNQFETLGIGTLPDALNRFAARSNAALFTAIESANGGSGDLRLVLNKEVRNRVVSLLYQTAFDGHAELGLLGDDDFQIRVSSNGTDWHDALRVDRTSGEVSFPAGAQGAGGSGNLLINADFSVNQRVFAGGGLPAGVYGYDRWKGGPGGCTLSRSDDTITLTGALAQVIERPGLADSTVTVSVDNPTGPLNISIGGAAGTITAGVGRRFATLTIPSAATGDIVVSFSGSGVSFARPVVNRGSVPERFRPPPPGVTLLLCQRYYCKTFAAGTQPAAGTGIAGSLCSYPIVANTIPVVRWQFPTPMRAVPTMSFFNPFLANAQWSAGGVNAAIASGAITSESVRIGVASPPAIPVGTLTTVHAVADAEL